MPIWQHQSVGNLLADMATQITAGQQLNYHAADCIDSGRRADMEAGMAKLFCSEMAAKVAPRRDPRSTAGTATRPSSTSSATTATRR